MNKKVSHLILALLLFLIVGWVLPTPDALPAAGKMALAVGVFAIAVWITGCIEGALSGLMIVFMLTITGAANLNQAFSGFSSTSLWLIVIGFLMAGVMEYSGLSKRIALHLVALSKGVSSRIYWSIAASIALLTFFVPSITARTLLMLPIILGIGESFKAKEGESNIVKALLLIVAMSGTMMSIGVLTSHVANPITVGLIQNATGTLVTWAEWFKVGGPPAFLLGFISVFLIKIMYPPEVENIGDGGSYVQKELTAMGPITKREIYTLVIFLFTLCLWATDTYTKIPVVTVGLLSVILLLLPGIGVMDWKEAQAKIPWSVYVLYGGGLSLGAVLVSSGAAKWLANTLLYPLIPLSSTMQIIALIWIVTFLQILFTGGGPKTTALTPIVIAFAGTVGADPLIMALVLGMNMQHQYLLPVSNMPNAVIVGTPHISERELMKTGALMSILGAGFFSIVVLTYWRWIGLL
ncbi:MAG TPA: DASS family sodium-coupled anion symporter [Candidatus Avacidaminococcus intestinavium]|uniref:Sodium-dependent dicarboxylate transporter SdcS n=1 Tax=Candidatus Avacidaminococcus intestinavium TaxID=2840684 RepID=A0A9D1MQA3_9FIRM|nr:DASS family sodium-coupled anion symporter [Candidatus Avacidaminococcus intestinavium]